MKTALHLTTFKAVPTFADHFDFQQTLTPWPAIYTAMAHDVSTHCLFNVHDRAGHETNDESAVACLLYIFTQFFRHLMKNVGVLSVCMCIVKHNIPSYVTDFEDILNCITRLFHEFVKAAGCQKWIQSCLQLGSDSTSKTSVRITSARYFIALNLIGRLVRPVFSGFWTGNPSTKKSLIDCRLLTFGTKDIFTIQVRQIFGTYQALLSVRKVFPAIAYEYSITEVEILPRTLKHKLVKLSLSMRLFAPPNFKINSV